ncbi:MAG TPA: hypothetical protein VK911_00555, partial [Vicinamibacterales bacterium]|nr:hypothetical protein [Vicinamibacterales bacterium]
ATLYYYLKADAQNVKLTIKDLEGTTIQEMTPTSKKGLQKVFWNLQRPPASGQPQAMGGRRGARPMVDPGVYKVTLTVDGKDVATRKLTVSPDPLFK